MYKPQSVLRRARVYKKRRGPLVLRNPRRRDIAPTGELAGLPARDAPKSSYDLARLSGEVPVKWRPVRFHLSAPATPAPIRISTLSHPRHIRFWLHCKPLPSPAQRSNRPPQARPLPWVENRPGIQRLDKFPCARVGLRTRALPSP